MLSQARTSDQRGAVPGSGLSKVPNGDWYHVRAMTLAELKASLSEKTPPTGVAALVGALWHDARGDWDRAHHIAQSVDDAQGAWVHAYLHRKEGDLSNAGYWYARAGRPRSEAPLDEEGEEIAEALLG